SAVGWRIEHDGVKTISYPRRDLQVRECVLRDERTWLRLQAVERVVARAPCQRGPRGVDVRHLVGAPERHAEPTGVRKEVQYAASVPSRGEVSATRTHVEKESEREARLWVHLESK